MFVIIVLFLAFFTNIAVADWQLNNAESRLNFISIKKGNVAEIHSFKQMKGYITQAGQLELTIDLNSVETAIPIRNERMINHLFETKVYPVAVIAAQVDTALSDYNVKDVNFTLNLHGKQDSFYTQVAIAKISEDKIIVSDFRPILVNADSFDLAPGIEILRDLAKLPSISLAVPVTFTLVFEKK